MKGTKIMKSVAEMGKKSAVKQTDLFSCRNFFYQPKAPAKLLEMKK